MPPRKKNKYSNDDLLKAVLQEQPLKSTVSHSQLSQIEFQVAFLP